MIAILCAAPVEAEFAQNKAPGVIVGNEFFYSLKSTWASNDSNAVMPSGLADINMIDYYKVTFNSVWGANVSTHTQWHYANGPNIETDGSMNTKPRNTKANSGQ